MRRAPTGIQLGKSVRPGFLRVLEGVIAGLIVLGAWGGISLWSIRAELADVARSGPGFPASSGPGGVDASPALESTAAHEAAVLLLAGVLDAPDISAVFDNVMETAPPGVRITGIEARPTGGTGRVEAVIAAEAVSASAVAGFLSALGDHESVLSTEVISETRQTDGEAMVRITAELEAGRGLR